MKTYHDLGFYDTPPSLYDEVPKSVSLGKTHIRQRLLKMATELCNFPHLLERYILKPLQTETRCTQIKRSAYCPLMQTLSTCHDNLARRSLCTFTSLLLLQLGKRQCVRDNLLCLP
jgi:hypothetical protein